MLDNDIIHLTIIYRKTTTYSFIYDDDDHGIFLVYAAILEPFEDRDDDYKWFYTLQILSTNELMCLPAICL